MERMRMGTCQTRQDQPGEPLVGRLWIGVGADLGELPVRDRESDPARLAFGEVGVLGPVGTASYWDDLSPSVSGMRTPRSVAIAPALS